MILIITAHLQKGKKMTKSNIHKKMTFEDKFDLKYACWVKNNYKAWKWWKIKARRDFRRIMKEEEKYAKTN